MKFVPEMTVDEIEHIRRYNMTKNIIIRDDPG